MSMSLIEFNKRINEDNIFRKELELHLTGYSRDSPEWYDKMIEFAKGNGFIIKKEELLKYFNSPVSEDELRSQIQIDKLNSKIKELDSILLQKNHQIEQFKSGEIASLNERKKIQLENRSLSNFKSFFWVILIMFILLLAGFIYYYINVNKKISIYKLQNIEYLSNISVLNDSITLKRDSLINCLKRLDENEKNIIDLRGRLTDKSNNVIQMQSNYDNLNNAIHENNRIVNEKNKIIKEKNDEITRLNNIIRNRTR